jgi:hypothetical protein
LQETTEQLGSHRQRETKRPAHHYKREKDVLSLGTGSGGLIFICIQEEENEEMEEKGNNKVERDGKESRWSVFSLYLLGHHQSLV